MSINQKNRSPKILLIEDESIHAKLIQRAFSLKGNKVSLSVVNSLKDARDFLKNTVPDLIIADLMLPDGKGTELLTNEKYTQQFPFIIMTSYGDENAAVEALKAGALDYLIKSESMLRDMPHIAEGALREWEHIIKRKDAESELKIMSIAMDSSINAIAMSDLNGNLIYVNPSFLEMWGFKNVPEALKSKATQLWYPQESGQKVLEEMKDKGSWIGELTGRRKDGTNFFAHLSASLVIDEAGKSERMITSVEDITEQKKTEEARKKLESQLYQSQKMEALGTLAGGIAHDFNNILGAIMGYTELSLDELPIGNYLRNNLKQVIAASQRAKDLVKQILAFSRKNEHEKRPIRISIYVRESLKLLRSTLPSTIEFRKNINNDSIIMADPIAIQQIMMNLCSNAAHAMKENGGVLEVNLTDIEITQENANNYNEISQGSYVMLTVHDSGPGITTAVMERIFDPYFTTKDIGDGTGMGLAMIHGLVKSHNGEIVVKSEEGKGAYFYVFFPILRELKEKETISPLEDNLPRKLIGGSESILFVDDEKNLVEIGEQMLKNLGYSVVSRTSSVEALEYFRKMPRKFDLLITDMAMPNLTGIQLTKEIHRIRPDVKVILCTGFSETINEENFESKGIEAFIMKPIVKKEIAQAVRQVLDNRENEGPNNP